jgi:hypothetical protein
MHNDVKAKLVQVIEVEHIRGGGVDNEPMRPVKTYWDMKGNRLAEYDPLFDTGTMGYGQRQEAVESRI